MVVKFNKVYLNPTCKQLILSVEIPDETWLENVYLDTIYITNINPADIDEATIDEEIGVAGEGYKEVIEGTKKQITQAIDYTLLHDVNLDKLIYVGVKIKGGIDYSDPHACCHDDRLVFWATAFDPIPIYNQGMNYIKELSQNCETPKNFIDFILRQQAFEYALKTGNYPKAEDLYNNYLKNGIKAGNSITYKSGCGCG